MPEKLSHGPRAGYDISRVGAGLSRGPNLRKKLTSAPWSETFPAPGATLDLDFVNNRGFVRGVGQGDAMQAITFTRASSGNYVGPDGLLRTGAGTFNGTTNALGVSLLSFPQDFDNAYWIKSNATVTANTEIAPDGTLTADLISYTATGSANRAIQSSNIAVTSGQTVTKSIYIKNNGQQFVQFPFLLSGSQYANFDLVNGTVTQTSASCTASIVDVGNGWFRCVATATYTSSGNDVAYIWALTSGTSGFAAATTTGSSVFAWGAQLEVGSSATTYYPTNINVPRFDWASVTQVDNRNLLSATQQLESATYWTKTGAGVAIAPIVTPNAGTDPDGNNNATRIQMDCTNTSTSANRSSVTQGRTLSSGVAYCGSIYIKAYDAANVGKTVRLTTDFVASTVYTLTANWQRVSWTATSTGTQGNLIIETRGTFTTQTADVLVYAPQLELGSTATAYQPISYTTTNTPLAANASCNGLLIEESRANRILWCRDATVTPNSNLLLRSQEFNTASWVTARAGVTANSIAAPDGTTTADTLIEDATAANNHQITQSVAVGNMTATASIYVKNYSGSRLVQFAIDDGTSANRASVIVNPTNGNIFSAAATAGTFSNASATVTTVGAFYRIALTGTGNIQRFRVSLADSTGNTSYNGDNASGVYLWGAQLERGDSVSTYEATTTTGAIWSKLNVTVSKTVTGIDGVANSATKITASAANGSLMQIITLASGSRTGSVYLKRITGTGDVQVSLDGFTWSTVDLSSTEWRRIVLSGTVTNPVVGIRLATNGDEVAMDYAQVEDGDFATSPILTTTASVTRGADVATVSGANFIPWFERNKGTIIVEADSRKLGQDVFVAFSSGTNYTAPFGMLVRAQLSGSVRVAAGGNNSSADVISNTFNTTTPIKVAATYRNTECSVSANLLPPATINTMDFTGIGTTALVFGALNTNQSQSIGSGRIKRVTYCPIYSTSQALQALSRP